MNSVSSAQNPWTPKKIINTQNIVTEGRVAKGTTLVIEPKGVESGLIVMHRSKVYDRPSLLTPLLKFISEAFKRLFGDKREACLDMKVNSTVTLKNFEERQTTINDLGLSGAQKIQGDASKVTWTFTKPESAVFTMVSKDQEGFLLTRTK